jgi:hypothetical protein
VTDAVIHTFIDDTNKQHYVVKDAHDVARVIRHMAERGGHGDLTPIHEASDGVRGKLDAMPRTKLPLEHDELKAAVDAANASPDRPRTFAVAYRNPRGAVKVAHGTHYSNGRVHVEDGHGVFSGYENSMNDLEEIIGDREYHIDYTDEV